ncbi:MAG TPA: phosphotransferase [Anaerolineales bacterium]|nr:phosphotransferase [Anaerolineales bacterium]
MKLEHAAVSAWRDLQPAYAAPENLEVFGTENGNTSVYRLVRVDEASTNVIAKRSRHRTARIERAIYEQVLPGLPLPTLHYYGAVEEPDGQFWWLFLEDVSHEARYLPHIQEHRVAAARWLGTMNIFASRLPAAAHLPERKPQHYLNLLRSARRTISSNLANPALRADHLALLETILAQCRHLSAHWSELASACTGIPRTLVHGDFISKNVRVRYGRDGIILLPFDWEKAGWGIPAEDISRVDLATYWSTVRDHWPGLALPALSRLMSVGKVFRCLVFLDWIAPSLASSSIEQPINELQRCETWLAGLIQSAAWRD